MKFVGTLIAVLLLAGCGVGSDGPTPAGDGPTGVAPGVTLYFVDGQERLQPERRPTGRLGSIGEAVSLLLTGPGPADLGHLHSEIAESSVTQVSVTTGSVIEVRLPLAPSEVTSLGIDQIVCTVLALHIQSGGPRTTRVRLQFTLPTRGSEVLRACPLIS